MSGALVKLVLTVAIGAVCAVAAYIATRPPVHAQGHHYGGTGPVRRRPRTPSPPRRPPWHSNNDDESDNETFHTPPELPRRRRGEQQRPKNASDKTGSSCKICLDVFEDLTAGEEIVSTSCGHIFCKKCILECFDNDKKCPTCRQEIDVHDLRRVYL